MIIAQQEFAFMHASQNRVGDRLIQANGRCQEPFRLERPARLLGQPLAVVIASESGVSSYIKN
jgi:hypothetical protein